MSFSLDLLEQADHLILREKKRPKQASLRRSVSNTYYALFHLLTFEAASLIAGRLEPASKVAVQRWFEHGSMYNACAVFAAESFSGTLVKLAGPAPLPDLQLIARAFRELQQARHSADYDMLSLWSRPKAQRNVQLARDAFTAWTRVRKDSQATVFALALLDLKRVQTERP